MSENGKPKLAMYWASSCGGCEISILNIHENILVVDEVFDLAFFPCIADFKTKDVLNSPDGYIDVCLFNGAIRNSENEEMAKPIRVKIKIVKGWELRMCFSIRKALASPKPLSRSLLI